MSYRQRNGFTAFLEAIYAVLFWGVCILLGGQWLQSQVPAWSPGLFWTLYGASLLGVVAAIVYLPGAVASVLQQRRKCVHGVAGGQTRELCEECRQERRAAHQMMEQATLRAQRQAELRQQAAQLEAAEIVRLTQARLNSRDYLLSLSPADFEDIVSEMFRKMGYAVEQTPYSNDHGKDAMLRLDGQLYVAEYKRYGSDKRIGRPHLQKLFAAMNEENADGGFFVTTADFATTAVAYAKQNRIQLINADELTRLMQKVFPADDVISNVHAMCLECGALHCFALEIVPKTATCHCGAEVTSGIALDSAAISSVLGDRFCPKCGNRLRLVRGYRGRFWGCKSYPSCRYTKPYVK